MDVGRPRKYRTQGIKGAKLPRINMAFDPDVYQFVRDQARKNSETMTRYVNRTIREIMAEQKERGAL